MSRTEMLPKRWHSFGLSALLVTLATCSSTPPKPPPPTGCTIDGMSYADGQVNPANPSCQICKLAISSTSWTNASDGTKCNQGNSVCCSGACRSACFIGGVCYAAPTLDPTNSCKVCHPAESTTDWSDLPTGATCADGGICGAGGACQVGCLIGGVVYPDRSNSPGDPSICCNQKAAPTQWTQRLTYLGSWDLGGPGADIVAADFNGDGIDDVAAVDLVHNTVSVLLSGSGGFMPLQTYPTDPAPRALVATDLNGDGKPDLVVTTLGPPASNMDVLLNQGNGTFGAKAPFASGTAYPGSMVAGDFNGDGKNDLVCAQDPEGVVFFAGLGNGQLAVGVPVLDAGAGEVTAADFNGDMVLDIAEADVENLVLTMMVGDGGGNFSPTQQIPTPGQITDVKAGDINGDGKIDLAVVFPDSGIAYVLYGAGDGTFSSIIGYPADGGPTAIGLADLTASGTKQLLVSNEGISVLDFGNDGGPTVTQIVWMDGGTGRMAVGDFNGDHAPDVAILGGTSISIFVNGCP